MVDEFVLPDFLQDCDVDTLHNKMMEELPDDIDKTEGGFPWDFTRPTAIIASELLEFYIPETIKLMFPQWSSGEFLDYLANMARISRKAPNFATATIEVEGEPGTLIEAGSVFSTRSTDSVEAIEFATMESCVLNENGKGSVVVQALIAGKESNVNANTITLLSVPIEGISSITNPQKASGGTEEELDDELRERILEANEDMDDSYIGNNADYKRWAEAVSGIGTAIVVPEWDGPETVKIVVLDANGEAANETLQKAVYNYIMSPDSPLDRLAPPNTILTVAAPQLIYISYSIESLSLESGFEEDMVLEGFRKGLSDYYKTVNKDEAVKYNWVHSILTNTPGVEDFKGLLVNGGKDNIPIDMDEYPYTDKIIAEGGFS
ncbi:MAG: baseplate J/gp47 family protein [Eubacteriales bacterium]|nr:baseplate J/gp47 family protein [Eubacteriales bacterium]